MRCPTLGELFLPPGKTGWPWTEESPQLSDTMPDGRPWPQVSVVTPSYNQEQFVEETIRSVLLQGYPNLEYIIIDGGSIDESVEIIRKYADWLAYWVSEPDRGQTDALNKGFARAHGEIVAWLNSDDTYEPGTLRRVAQEFGEDQARVVIYGNCNFVDENGSFLDITRTPHVTYNSLIRYWRRNALLAQPAVFFRRKVLEKVGPLNCDLRFVMDYDLWLRIAREHKFHRIEHTLANYRLHSESKTNRGWTAFAPEFDAVSRQHWGPKASWRYICFSLDRSVHLRIGTKLRAVLNWAQQMLCRENSKP